MPTLTISPPAENKPCGANLNKILAKIGDGFQYDTLIFTKGTYLVDTPLLVNGGTEEKPTVLKGEAGAIIKLIAKAPESVFPSMKPILGQKKSKIANVVFDGLTFDGNKNNQIVNSGAGFHNFIGLKYCTNIEIKNCYLHDSQGDGARITHGTNVSYHDNKVCNLGHDGLYIDHGENVVAYNNYTETRTNSAIRLRHATKGHVYDNYIINKLGASSTGPGIQIEVSTKGMTSTGILIERNVIKNAWAAGIWVICRLNTNTNAATDLTIKNNLFIGCGGMDSSYHHIPGVGQIVADGWDGLEICYNTFDRGMGYGVLLGDFKGIKSSGKGYSAKIYRNIITNTTKANTIGTASGSAIANWIPEKYTSVLVYENCVYGNVSNYYKVDAKDCFEKDPLFADPENEDYHLKSTEGRFTPSEYVKDTETSPCVYAGYELGCYSGWEPSLFAPPWPPNPPCVVIPKRNEEELKTYVKMLRDTGALELTEKVTFINVSEGFTE